MEEADFLKSCLNSYRDSSFDCNVEVVVVLNGLDVAAREFLESNEDIIKLYIDQPLGRGEARNKALDLAKGKIIYFIDDDVILPKGTIQSLYDKFESYPNVSIIGGPNLGFPNENEFQKCCSLVLASRFGVGPFVLRYKQGLRDKITNDNDLILCNLAIKKFVFNNILFCKDVAANEENIFMQEAMAMGHQLLYSPEVFVYHYRGDNLLTFIKKCMNYGHGRADNLFINPKSSRFYLLCLLLLIFYIIFSLMFFRKFLWMTIVFYMLFNFSVSLAKALKYLKILSLPLMSVLFASIHFSYFAGLFGGILKNVGNKYEHTR